MKVPTCRGGGDGGGEGFSPPPESRLGGILGQGLCAFRFLGRSHGCRRCRAFPFLPLNLQQRLARWACCEQHTVCMTRSSKLGDICLEKAFFFLDFWEKLGCRSQCGNDA